MKIKVYLFTVVFLLCSSVAFAVPKGHFTNIFERLSWSDLFPLKVGGVTMKGASENYDIEDKTEDAVCVCDFGPVTQIGTTVSYWEPARMVETVKDPYYSPFLGAEFKIGDGKAGQLHGVNQSDVDGDASISFQQTHFFVFPALKLLELMMGMTCGEMSPFDISYLSELDPNWNDALLSMTVMPDALLFSNPYAVMACMADAVAASFEHPIDPMFWCMGYDLTYPLTGATTNANFTAANFTIAGRTLFLQARYLNMPDTAMSECMNVPFPVLWKSHYKLQLGKPVKANRAIPLGMMDLLWESGKNPMWSSALNFSSGNSGQPVNRNGNVGTATADNPGVARPAMEQGGTAQPSGNMVGKDGESSDNFLWFMFRKQLCCYM